MKALDITKQLNKILRCKLTPTMTIKAYELYNALNAQRQVEGLIFVRLPNLETAFAKLTPDDISKYNERKK